MSEAKENNQMDAGQPEVVGLVVKKRDHRHHCGRLMFRGYFPPGTDVTARCPKCKGIYVLKLAMPFDAYKVKGE